MNAVFRIAFGDYELSLDRRTLAYDLTETKTQTRWGVGLSVGWIEVASRESGEIARHDFGDCKLISLSEKMSGQGKRLLLGLDTPEGLPVDIYFTCAEKEIQLTVEASRDSKTHILHAIGLLPGLCSVPDDGKSHFVLPIGEGAMVFPSEVHEERTFPLWQWREGLTMPFLGAVRGNYPLAPENCPLTPSNGGTGSINSSITGGWGAGLSSSALCLITDSAYASARLSKTSCDWEYARDPERRRLEIRLVLIPGGDHVAIARAYRDKLVGERAHVTLRKKIRERPEVQKAISEIFAFPQKIDTPSLFLHNDSPISAVEDEMAKSRWDVIEQASEMISIAKEIRGIAFEGDWSAPFVDIWMIDTFSGFENTVPLISVVYRDSVIRLMHLKRSVGSGFLRILINIGRPLNTESSLAFDEIREARKTEMLGEKILQNLYSLTFAAFLKEHRFLTEDFAVQEAVYTDKTRVVVNFSEENAYETEEFSLPPLGFYVNNSQMVLHDASRVGDEVFSERAWRVSRKSEAGEWTREEFPLGENLRGPI